MAWNFIERNYRDEIPEYESRLNTGDWDLNYKITKQSRRFVKLELNNISDLKIGILIFLRASHETEIRAGISHLNTIKIGFYELVMLLNQTEKKIYSTLLSLEGSKLIDLDLAIINETGRVYSPLSKMKITQKGIKFLEREKTIMHNININNSNIGVFALESTLSSIDVNIEKIKQQIDDDKLIESLTRFTEKVVETSLDGKRKQEILEQVDVISEEAAKDDSKRRPAIIKPALHFVEKLISNTANLSTIWTTLEFTLRLYFNI